MGRQIALEVGDAYARGKGAARASGPERQVPLRNARPPSEQFKRLDACIKLAPHCVPPAGRR
jgi:hypothetical protein